MGRRPSNQRADGRFEKKVRINENGKSYLKSVYGHSQLELEQNIAKALGKRFDLNPTLSELLDEWYEQHSKTIKHNTRECYIAPIKDIKAEFGKYKVTEITPKEMQQFLNRMATQGYSKQTIKMRLFVFHMVFDYAVLQGILLYNPTSPLKVPKTAQSRKVPMPTENEIQTVIDNVRAPFGLFPYWLLYSGLRKSELLALQYEDIYDGYIHVNKSVEFDHNQPVVRPFTKTESGIRSVPLLKPLQEVLGEGKGYLFSENGKPLTKSMVNKRWANYKKETGLEISMHQLRHGFATMCFDAGLDPKDTQSILGHSNISVTMDIYTDISNSRRDKATEKLNSYLTNI